MWIKSQDGDLLDTSTGFLIEYKEATDSKNGVMVRFLDDSRIPVPLGNYPTLERAKDAINDIYGALHSQHQTHVIRKG